MIWYALIVSSSLNVLFAALVFKMFSTTTHALERSHERTTEYTEGLVNRIMSRDYQEYQAYEVDPPLADEETPDTEPELVPVDGPDRGGFGSRLGLRALTERRHYDEDEAQLAASEELLSAELP